MQDLLDLLLGQGVELGSSGHGHCSHDRELEEKHGMCDGFSTFWGDRVDM